MVKKPKRKVEVLLALLPAVLLLIHMVSKFYLFLHLITDSFAYFNQVVTLKKDMPHIILIKRTKML